jgi:hypothetical protein
MAVGGLRRGGLVPIPEEPEEDITEAGAPPATKGKSGRTSFARLRRELSEEELASPAVQRLLLDDIDRLEGELNQLGEFRARFHECDKHCGILQQRVKIHLAQEVVHLSCFSVGSAAIGYAYNLWHHQPAGWIALAFGVVLVGMGIAAKVLRR